MARREREGGATAQATGVNALLREAPWVLALLLVLAPVLLVKAAVTVDGPTTLYNAWVAAELARDPASPLGNAYSVRPSMGQNLVSAATLRALGPVLGWELAERAWLGALLAALLASLGWYVRRTVPGATPLAPLFLAWVPLGLVTAWGFYDFLAGMVLFALLLDALGDGGRARIVPLLALLYFAHLFAFATAVAVVVLRSLERPDLRVTAAGVVVAGGVLVLAAPALGGGMIWESSIRSRLIRIAFSSVFETVSPLALLAGAVWTALLVTGAIHLRWDWRCRAGFLLLAGSAFVPTSVGGGSFLFQRLHILALITLAPLVIQTITRLPRLATGVLSLLMAGLLAVVFGAWTGAGRQLDEDRYRITTLLRTAGVEQGAAVASAFLYYDLLTHRAPLGLHLVDRSALDLGAILADNYQASTAVYSVSWSAQRTAVRTHKRGDEWSVRGGIGAALYVVHDTGARLDTGRALPLVDDGRFAVTRLSQAEATAPDEARTRNEP
jgi:hypothetical protein